MRLIVDGKPVLASDGGGGRDAERPLAIFLHGAGMDRSVWASQTRAFPSRGLDVLAVDLPGHGGSAGPALGDISALADWTLALMSAAGVERASLVGHSMGALIALEAAARAPQRVAHLALVGVGVKMPVHPDLLAAAATNDHAAVDMVSLWSLGAAAQGGCPTPGLWMLGGAERLLELSRPGVLHTDLAACNAYRDALAAAAKIASPTTLILGERDMMTPLKSGQALAAAIAGARVTVLRGVGHLPMAQAPRETLAALKAALL
ncbi:MAG TPA: alpha/beta fold hydrolase [Roseiarcus sp.]|nr:alpha/beta fold hydrolase [Roseiarcus sp.]